MIQLYEISWPNMLHIGSKDTVSCLVCYTLICESISYHMQVRLTLKAEELQFVHPNRHGAFEYLYYGCHYTVLCLLKDDCNRSIL